MKENNFIHNINLNSKYKYLLMYFLTDFRDKNTWDKDIFPLLEDIKSGMQAEVDWRDFEWGGTLCFRKKYIMILDISIYQTGRKFPPVLDNNGEPKINKNLEWIENTEFIEENYHEFIKIPIKIFINICMGWYLEIIRENKIKKDSNSKKTVCNHLYKKEKIKLIYVGYDLGYRDSLIEKFKVVSNSKKTIINEFNSGIKQRLNSFCFAYKNWLFIPEILHYYLYNLENGGKHNQTVWLRENKRNHQDANIGNYFRLNKHFTINRKSFVIFDLHIKEKQTIKFKNLLGEISWAYSLNENILRVFFNSENKMGCYNIKDESFFDIHEIVTKDDYLKVTLINFIDYKVEDDKHITNFMIMRDEMNHEAYQFIENIKLNN